MSIATVSEIRHIDGAIDPRLLLQVLTRVKKGDFSTRMPLDQTGITGRIYEALNAIIEQEDEFTTQVKQVSRAVGKEGIVTRRLLHTGGGLGQAHAREVDLAHVDPDVVRLQVPVVGRAGEEPRTANRVSAVLGDQVEVNAAG